MNGGGGGVPFPFLLSSLLQRLRQVILEAAARTPAQALCLRSVTGGRGFPLLPPCWKEKLTFSSVTTLRAQNFLLSMTLCVLSDG